MGSTRYFKNQLCLCLITPKPMLQQSAKAITANLKPKLAVIPGGITSQLQPLDVSVNKSFKALMKKADVVDAVSW